MKLARDVKRQTAGSLDRYAVLRQKVCVNADRALGKPTVTDKRRFDAEGGENGDEKAQRGTGFTAIDRDALGRRARRNAQHAVFFRFHRAAHGAHAVQCSFHIRAVVNGPDTARRFAQRRRKQCAVRGTFAWGNAHFALNVGGAVGHLCHSITLFLHKFISLYLT